MQPELSTAEMIVLSALAVLMVFWLRPGIKAAMARSKQVSADWQSVVVPLGLVVMFVLFLIAMV
jgi:hypothetical protein